MCPCFVDFENAKVSIIEKGRATGTVRISKEALNAIEEYIELERTEDAAHFSPDVLFLASATNRQSTGPLSPRMINNIWAHVCEEANITDKTVHGARHRVGTKLYEKTKNIRVPKDQLLHKNAIYTMQYITPTDEEMEEAINS